MIKNMDMGRKGYPTLNFDFAMDGWTCGTYGGSSVSDIHVAKGVVTIHIKLAKSCNVGI